MSLKASAKGLLGALGRQAIVAEALRRPSVERALGKLPGSHLLYGSGWERKHPFDVAHGTDTSGFSSPDLLPRDAAAREHAVFYAGSQPSIVRAALASLPGLESCTFFDLGCGKGRALLVATEFPFRHIQGVELSPDLAEIARRNSRTITGRFPRRTQIRVQTADATSVPLPAGDVVLYLYHPFAPELVAKVLAHVEAALEEPKRRVFVVYYNPVAGNLFDASSKLTRRFARVLPYAPDEVGFGPDPVDAVVIWQGGLGAEPVEGVDAPIVVLPGGGRALLEVAGE